MRTIIAGSRDITDYGLVKEAIRESGFDISLILWGGARGVDTLGKRYADEHAIPSQLFAAEWDNLDVEPLRVKTGQSGKLYNALAGFIRNEKMAKNADALVAITRGSSGTADMIERATALGLKIYVKKVKW